MALSPVYRLTKGSLDEARRFIRSGDSAGLATIIELSAEAPNPSGVAIPLVGEIMNWTGASGLSSEFGRVGNFMAGVVTEEATAQWHQRLTDLLARWPDGSLPGDLNEYLVLYMDEGDLAKRAIQYLVESLECPREFAAC